VNWCTSWLRTGRANALTQSVHNVTLRTAWQMVAGIEDIAVLRGIREGVRQGISQMSCAASTVHWIDAARQRTYQ